MLLWGVLIGRGGHGERRGCDETGVTVWCVIAEESRKGIEVGLLYPLRLLNEADN